MMDRFEWSRPAQGQRVEFFEMKTTCTRHFDSSWGGRTEETVHAEDTRSVLSSGASGMTWTSYSPIATYGATLYRDFLSLDIFSDLEVAGFITRYGTLTSSGLESMAKWLDEQNELRAFLTLVDVIRRPGKGQERLLRVVRVESLKGAAVVNLALPRLDVQLQRTEAFRTVVDESVGRGLDLLDDAKCRNVWGIGRTCAASMLRDRFQDLCGMTVVAEGRGEETRFVVHPRPLSLLGSMWLLAARLLETAADIRTCEQCGREYDAWDTPSGVLDGRQRSSSRLRRYCSPACKQKAYRQSKSS